MSAPNIMAIHPIVKIANVGLMVVQEKESGDLQSQQD